MKDTFDIKKFLTENTLTTQSRLASSPSTVQEVEEIPNVPPTIEEEVESEYMTGAYDFMMFAAENLDNSEIEGIWDDFNNEYGDGSKTSLDNDDEEDPIGDAENDHYDSMDRMGYRS